MLQSENTSKAKSQIRELGDQFHAALLAYDEGLLTNDKVLASALWRRFFEMNCRNPKDLETMVKYVRRQVSVVAVFLDFIQGVHLTHEVITHPT